ncbi:hypothetical protein EIK77_010627 [Talaromyces pinophilus]|nr:hypothetical protein EIK77_010627 [Talaromyces pinophilus]
MDFQNSITEDLALIDIIPDMTSNSSDYFQQMHDLAVQLIKDGKAFADDSELGKGDDSRKNRLPSKHRDMGIEETLAPANRKHIDPISPRHVAIAADDVVYCDVIDKNNHGSPPDTAVHEVPKYVKNTSLGTRKIQTGRTIVIEHGDARSFELGEMITLMNWGNAVVRAISMIPPDAGAEASVSGDVPDFLVKYLVLELDLSSQDFKKTKKITWLAATDDKMISVELMAFDHLITKDKLEPTDVLEECLTPVMQFTTRAFADCNVVDREKGAVI